MRVFFSTGEVSGETLAADLLVAMRGLVPGRAIEARAIGNERLAAAGATIVRRTEGWASLGPLQALRRIPPLYAAMIATAVALVRDPPDLVVLVDFGAFNLRLARTVRKLGGRVPILYYFPPSAWLDRAGVACEVARRTDALTAFAHQRDFYRSLGLPIGYAGHPLVSRIAPRPPRPPAPPDGGHVALLPGSRAAEIARHTPPMLAALERLRAERPALRATLVAVDDAAAAAFRAALARAPALEVAIARDARPVLAAADAALIASGTAVLEAALLETPCSTLYILSAAQERYVRRVFRRAYVTLPNLVLDAPAVAERIGPDATPEHLAADVRALLDAPAAQLAAFRALRDALGPPDALDRCARFALELAGAVP